MRRGVPCRSRNWRSSSRSRKCPSNQAASGVLLANSVRIPVNVSILSPSRARASSTGLPTTMAAWMRRAGWRRWFAAPAPREAPTDWTSRIPAGARGVSEGTGSVTCGSGAIGRATGAACGRIRLRRGLSRSRRRSGETRIPNHRRNRLRSKAWIPPRSSKPWWMSSAFRALARPMITSMS